MQSIRLILRIDSVFRLATSTSITPTWIRVVWSDRRTEVMIDFSILIGESGRFCRYVLRGTQMVIGRPAVSSGRSNTSTLLCMCFCVE